VKWGRKRNRKGFEKSNVLRFRVPFAISGGFDIFGIAERSPVFNNLSVDTCSRSQFCNRPHS